MKRKKKVRDIVSVSMDYVGRSKVKKGQGGETRHSAFSSGVVSDDIFSFETGMCRQTRGKMQVFFVFFTPFFSTTWKQFSFK